MIDPDDIIVVVRDGDHFSFPLPERPIPASQPMLRPQPKAIRGMTYFRIACRGFLIVFLTASNVVQVSHGHYGGALIGGCLISTLWWANSHAAKANVPSAALAYGAGAGLGTIGGMWLTAWWYG